MGVVSTVIGDGRHYKFAAENHASKGLKINKGWIVKFMLVTFPRDASEKEIERAFCYYGLLRGVWVARNPAGFAFVEYEDPRDAEDLDGTNVCGSRVRVEHSTGKVRPKPWMRGSRGPQRTRRPFHPEDRCFECGDRGHYAYDCSRFKRGGWSRSARNRTSRSRSHSRSGRSFSRSWSRSSSRSRSPRRVSRSRSRN